MESTNKSVTDKNKERNKHSMRIPVLTVGIVSAIVISFIFNQIVHRQNKNEVYEERNDMLGI